MIERYMQNGALTRIELQLQQEGAMELSENTLRISNRQPLSNLIRKLETNFYSWSIDVFIEPVAGIEYNGFLMLLRERSRCDIGLLKALYVNMLGTIRANVTDFVLNDVREGRVSIVHSDR
jgi:hypothetical protein